MTQTLHLLVLSIRWLWIIIFHCSLELSKHKLILKYLLVAEDGFVFQNTKVWAIDAHELLAFQKGDYGELVWIYVKALRFADFESFVKALF
jgi:hypothetical protein